jgi:hypothetical protein
MSKSVKVKKPRKRQTAKSPAPAQLTQLESIGVGLKALRALPDETFVTDGECEIITRLSRTSIWRIEHGLDRQGRKTLPPEPLLKSIKIGPKRKVRLLGNLRKYVRQREEVSGSIAA